MKRDLRLRGRGDESRRLLLLAVLIWLLFIAIASLQPRGGGADGVLEVTDPRKLEESIPREGASVVFFKAYGCPGCAKVEPALLKYIKENGSVKLVVANLSEMSQRDYAETLNIMRKYNVPGTPTLLLYVNGSLVARKVGVFGPGDQYEGLKKFVEEGLARAKETKGTEAPASGSGGALELLAFLSGSLFLGLLAAVSPCSLPVLLVYASTSRQRPGAREAVKKAAALWAAAAAGGLLLALTYYFSSVTALNVYGLLTSFLASLVVAWGALTLWSSNPTLVNLPQLSRAAPLLGLQCSLPFLLTLIAIAGSSPLQASLGGLLFALGFSLPFTALSSATSLANAIVGFMNSRAAIVLQGAALVAAGLYVLYYLYPDFSILL
ncbi:MAG: thioredoxin fold domain-containing protein [Acidilobaceae archaeon]|nr:thioredoxin fold domain-containing protein [Acidilobaceae archaeon]